MLHAITLDDREKTPNFGKPLFNSATLVATPEISVVGIRLYSRINGEDRAIDEVHSSPSKEGKVVLGTEKLDAWKNKLDSVSRLSGIIEIVSREAGLSQKKPVVLEVGVGGGELRAQFDYLSGLLRKRVKFSEIFKAGSYVDVIAITKGKGFEGPVTRFGVKRKQHKSRKSVRAVGVIGPWHPAAVTYTTPRAGQRGFHQRTEIGKRILSIGNGGEDKLTPPEGFIHFGVVNGDYVLLKGSIPGSSKRLVIMRHPMRMKPVKVSPPQIMEISTKIGV
jgi:large subunit ribosomal protein L3